MHRRGHFWTGRNGSDALSIASSFIACLLLVISLFMSGNAFRVLWFLGFLCLAISYFRIFSRNLDRRQRENQAFLRLISPFTRWKSRMSTRRRQKNLYCFFKCPQCGTVLRVPKGKGRIRITCKNCNHVFERNS